MNPSEKYGEGPVLKLPKNTVGRDFVVGDLHGCLQDFLALLKEIGFDKEKDRMFSVGDLIDRGPDSLNCAQLIYEKWMYVCRANHEQMMIDCTLNTSRAQNDMWAMNGGSWHHEVDIQLLKCIAEDMNKLPFVISIGEGDDRINLVHAELIVTTDADVDNWHTARKITPEWQYDNIIWGRSLVYESDAEAPGLSLTIVGHTPQVVPMYHENANHLYIDTGCFIRHRPSHTPQDRWLTCADITNKYDITLISYSGLYGVTHRNKLEDVERIK
jgi:serine/threonine protein phosphatase 1